MRQQKEKQMKPRNRCSVEIFKHMVRAYSQVAGKAEATRDLDGQAHERQDKNSYRETQVLRLNYQLFNSVLHAPDVTYKIF